jgi:hypothetical protein
VLNCSGGTSSITDWALWKKDYLGLMWWMQRNGGCFLSLIGSRVHSCVRVVDMLYDRRSGRWKRNTRHGLTDDGYRWHDGSDERDPKDPKTGLRQIDLDLRFRTTVIVSSTYVAFDPPVHITELGDALRCFIPAGRSVAKSADQRAASALLRAIKRQRALLHTLA